MASDEDCQIMTYLLIGTNIYNELVICIEKEDGGWDYPEGMLYTPKRRTYAILDADNMQVMAKRLRVEVKDLSNYLSQKFCYAGYISRSSKVYHEFQKILNFILDCGAKYRLKETASPRECA